MLVARGCRWRDVAAKLGISPYTVSQHLRNIMRKASVGTRAELVCWAVRNRLVEP